MLVSSESLLKITQIKQRFLWEKQIGRLVMYERLRELDQKQILGERLNHNQEEDKNEIRR